VTHARSLRLAHRGDWRRAPENSLAALTAATRVPGVDGVEFDVRLSRDGVPVLLHDETLARVQHRPERIDELDADSLAAAGVPTLAEALAALGPDPFLDIELKGVEHAEATAAVLRAARGETGPRTVISSFESETLAAMADWLPGWTLWLDALDLAPATVSRALGLGCRGIAVLWAGVTPAAIRRMREAGLDTAAWTVRRRVTYERLERLGVAVQVVEAGALNGGAGANGGALNGGGR
jgi:glycerophosphoryl diester phosphodiesterase